MEDFKEAIGYRAPRAYSFLMNGAKVAIGLGALARYFDSRDVLRWFGFRRRRRTVLGTMALLGAGVAVGAGIAVFASPMSGEETRRGLWRSLRKLGKKGQEIIETAESEVREHAGEAKAGATREKEGGGKRQEQKGGEQRTETSGTMTPGNAARGEGSKAFHS